MQLGFARVRGLSFSIVYILVWFTTCAVTVRAETTVPEVDIERILELIEEERCQEAWEMLWENAEQGSGAAYATLAQALDSGALIPPTISVNRAKILRDISFFSLKALAVPDSEKQSKIYSFPSFLNIVDNLLPRYFEFLGSGDFLGQCRHLKKGWAVCLERAVAEGYITSDREFLQELEAAYALGIQANCFIIGYDSRQINMETVPLINPGRTQENNGR